MKERLRREYLKKRNSEVQSSINRRSKKIFDKLVNLNAFKTAKCVMFYVSFGSEVNTQLMINKLLDPKFLSRSNIYKKVICVPIIDKNDLIPSIINKFSDLNKRNGYGILEPTKIKKISKNKIDLVIVPGIIFDNKGYRIGYGKGYYDLFLRDYSGFKVGLCLKSQIITKIPKTNKDVPVDLVIFD